MVDGRGPLTILAMNVPTDVLVARLSARRICGACGLNAPFQAGGDAVCPRCGGQLVVRKDDDEDVVRERLKVYERQTQPLVKYYRDRPTFLEIDGNRPPETVYAALQAALAPVGVRRRTPGADRAS
jgi:adenylate kinase